MKTKATRLYPFVPSGSSYKIAMEFFGVLGFEPVWQHPGIAGLRFGEAYFILQDVDVPEWQKNQMITFEVDDLDTYWSELESKNLETIFPGVKLKPPTLFPWGRELHIIDPGGVCWHVRQAEVPAASQS